MNLGVTLATGRKGDSLQLRCPVMTASGTFGLGGELARTVDLARLGAIVSPGVGLRSRRPRDRTLVAEQPAALLAATPYPVLSLRLVLRDALPRWQASPAPVIVNLPAVDRDECAEIIDRLIDHTGIAGFELDLGALRQEGRPVVTAAAVHQLITAASNGTPLPVIAKLPPDAPTLIPLARTAVEAGADAVCLGGGIAATFVDLASRRLRSGALIGPATRPMIMRCVSEVAASISVPVIASGGVAAGDDAVAYLLAGATAVQVGSATFANPRAPLDVIEGIEQHLTTIGETDIRNLIGAAML